MAATDPSQRPFRFGVQLSGGLSANPSPAAVPGDRSWVDLAKRIEGLGYDAITMPDHFTRRSSHRCPALMAAAAATERIRVGALVFDNDYKHPLVLAKELATIDVLSGGRRRHRDRRRLDAQRLRRSRHAVRPAGRPHRPLRGGDRGHQGVDGARGRSRSPASTTRSRTTTGSRSLCRRRTRRS